MSLPRVIPPTLTLEAGFRAAYNDTANSVAIKADISDAGLINFYGLGDVLLFSLNVAAILALKSQIPATNNGEPIAFTSASEDTEGTGKIATSDEAIAGINEFKWITPAVLAYVLDTLQITEQTLEKVIVAGSHAQTAPHFDGSIYATLQDPPAGVALLTVQVDQATGKFYKGGSTVVTPPTAPPDVWRNFVHYEEVADEAGAPIYATVDNGDYLPDDTPVPVVANPQADVTITTDGDQTITLAENEFTVVGGTKTLIVKLYNPENNTVYNLPEGITFDPSTRVITIAGTYANQVITLRVTCLDILNQANWDDFVLTVNRSIPANTVKYAQARFVPNYFGSGSSADLLEIQMMDGYADTPMYISVLLSSATAPTSFSANFQRLTSGVGNIRSYQLASGQNLKSKTFKIYISTATSGAANVGVYTITTGTTSTGFVTL